MKNIKKLLNLNNLYLYYELHHYGHDYDHRDDLLEFFLNHLNPDSFRMDKLPQYHISLYDN